MKLLSLEAYLVKMKSVGGVMKQIERKALVKLVLEANE